MYTVRIDVWCKPLRNEGYGVDDGTRKTRRDRAWTGRDGRRETTSATGVVPVSVCDRANVKAKRQVKLFAKRSRVYKLYNSPGTDFAGVCAAIFTGFDGILPRGRVSLPRVLSLSRLSVSLSRGPRGRAAHHGQLEEKVA